MRQHPISPVTEPTQYRAIGVVRGLFEPLDPEHPTRGLIHTADGTALEAVVLGRLLTLMRRHLDLAVPHLWVVYPRSREEGKLHLQMVGVWEPSTLAPEDAEAAQEVPGSAESELSPAGAAPAGDDAAGSTAAGAAPAATVDPRDCLPEGDDYFSVRGELIFTRPETGDLVVKVRQQPRPDGSRPTPFKLQLRGQIPLEHLRHFVALDLRRQGQQLCLEQLEVLAPISTRGTRGGKARRGGDRSGRGGSGSAGGAAPRRPAGAGPGAGRDHGRAISRPSR